MRGAGSPAPPLCPQRSRLKFLQPPLPPHPSLLPQTPPIGQAARSPVTSCGQCHRAGLPCPLQAGRSELKRRLGEGKKKSGTDRNRE
ncbi:unnamed protein product [Urochloa humidicola]